VAGAASTRGVQEGDCVLRIYDVALNVVRVLRPVIDEIGRRDSDLARQLRRCGASMVLNIAEGSYARKGNKAALYSVALGSAKETRACLDVAEALGYLDGIDEAVKRGLDSVCAVLFKLA
jgi:four helix bundle protein